MNRLSYICTAFATSTQLWILNWNGKRFHEIWHYSQQSLKLKNIQKLFKSSYFKLNLTGFNETLSYCLLQTSAATTSTRTWRFTFDGLRTSAMRKKIDEWRLLLESFLIIILQPIVQPQPATYTISFGSYRSLSASSGKQIGRMKSVFISKNISQFVQQCFFQQFVFFSQDDRVRNLLETCIWWSRLKYNYCDIVFFRWSGPLRMYCNCCKR